MSTRWSRVVFMRFSSQGSKGRLQIVIVLSRGVYGLLLKLLCIVFFSSVVLSWNSMAGHCSFLLSGISEERGNRDWNRGSSHPSDLAWKADLPIYASKMFDKNLNRYGIDGSLDDYRQYLTTSYNWLYSYGRCNSRL